MRLAPWLILTAVGVGFACGDSTGTQMAGNVAVSVSTQRPTLLSPAVAASRARALDDTITSGSDTLILTRARLVLREIEFERDENACQTQTTGCEEIEFGPVLIDLPLQPGVQREFSAELPPGIYDEVEFKVHKPDDDDPQDLEFIQQNPTFVDVSIRVEGTYNGTPFVFESDLNADQVLALIPALTITETTVTNVTVFVNLDAWFRQADGTLVDPATANKGGANENLVRDNIIASFEAFEDRDEDGDSSDG